MKGTTIIPCEFTRGADDYINLQPAPLVVSQTDQGGTLATAHVVHASGVWVISGEVYMTANGIECRYHTTCDGQIAFEQYGCTIHFLMEGLVFDDTLESSLTHISGYAGMEVPDEV